MKGSRFLREPLVHFVAIGLLLFGLEALFGRDGGRHRVVIGKEVAPALSDEFTQAQGRAPSAEELAGLVDRWAEEEILYRAGLERGLEKDDPRIRERVALKMSRVLSEGVIVKEPSEAELVAWFEAQPERFAAPPLIDFTQVFVAGTGDDARARAQELLVKLEAGADPAGLGDTFSGGRRYRHRKIADLAATFGEPFVAGLAEQAEGSWVLRVSPHGQHVVRVDKLVAGTAPTFDAARAEVVKDWKDEKRKDGLAKAIEGLRAKWTVERE